MVERRIRRAGAGLLAAVALASCRSPDPQAVLRVTDTETYWAVDSARGTTQYIAPAVRFRLVNTGPEPLRSVQATATFRRKGEEAVTWGSDFRQIADRRHPIAPGQEVWVVLKSDARYYSAAAPEAMFQHADFKDASSEVFLRVGSSAWSPFARADVERRIGAKTVQEFAAGSPAPGESPITSLSGGAR